MISGIVNHHWCELNFNHNFEIEHKIRNTGEKIYFNPVQTIIESNAVGAIDGVGYIKYTGAADIDRIHISSFLKFVHLGSSPKIINLNIYTGNINSPDQITSIKIRHMDLSNGSLTTDWENDTPRDSGKTHEYNNVNVTLLTKCIYFIEITLKGDTTGIDLNGFLIQWDYI